jgi:hypothetical protein
MCFDKSGNFYFAESGNSRVRKINTSGIISTYAGNGICGFGGNGTLATATSICVFGICIDNTGNLYIADQVRRVYKVNSLGIITFYAGNGIDGSNGDGSPATTAETEPYLLAVDKYGNLFIDEYERSKIRMVNSKGLMTTIAGNGTAGYTGDNGPATAAEINFPAGLCLDSCDNIYIADSRTFRIRKISFPECNYLAVNEITQEKSLNISPHTTTSTLTI